MLNLATNADPKHDVQAPLPAPSVVSADRLAEFALTAADAMLAAGGGVGSSILRAGGIPAAGSASGSQI